MRLRIGEREARHRGRDLRFARAVATPHGFLA